MDLWLSPPDDAPGARRYLLRVDVSERHAALLELARNCGDFDVQLERLALGDYFIDRGIVVERKTYADFATSLADGRLFPQAAALARSPHRPLGSIERVIAADETTLMQIRGIGREKATRIKELVR